VWPVPRDTSCQPCRLRLFAPRHGAHIHVSISDARAFGLAVKAGGGNVPPTLEGLAKPPPALP
jgi:hypothetical protein